MRALALVLAIVLPSVAAAQTPLAGAVHDGAGGPLTIEGSPYLVSEYAHVPTGTTLTVAPGVTVLHGASAYWWVDGTLVADGTLGQRIVFRGESPEPGAWSGISVTNTGMLRLRQVDVEGGGAGGSAQVSAYEAAELVLEGCRVRDGADDGLRGTAGLAFSIAGSTFQGNGGDGIELAHGVGGHPELAGNAITDNGGSAYRLGPDVFPTGSAVAGNGFDGIAWTSGSHVVSGTLDLDLQLPAGSWFGVAPGTTVTLAPGVTAFHGESVYWWIDGALVAEGTEADRIAFLPLPGAAGPWSGISVTHSGTLRVRLADIEGGGASGAALVSAYEPVELVLDRCGVRDSADDGLRGTTGATFEVTGCTFEGNAGYGMDLVHGVAGTPAIADVTLTGNGEAALRLGPDLFPDGVVVAGNGFDGIEFVSGAYTTSGTIALDLVVPAGHVVSVAPDATVTLAPGVTASHGQGAYWWVDGTLLAEGTEAERIAFLGLAPQPGAWSGLSITGSGAVRLRYADVAHGGEGGAAQVAVHGAREVMLEACGVRDGLDDGVRGTSGEAFAILGCALSGNAGNGIDLWRGSGPPPTLEGNTLTANGGAAYRLGPDIFPTGGTVGANGFDGIESAGGMHTRSGTWEHDVSVPPGQWVGVGAGTTLTLPPGFLAVNADSAYWWVEGTLQAAGTEEAPVRFTGAAAAPGAWSGLTFAGGSTGRLAHAIVEHAGGGGAAQVSASQPAELSITDSVVWEGAGIGVRVDGGPSTMLTITGSLLLLNLGDGAEVSVQGEAALTCNEFKQNGGHGLEVIGGSPLIRHDAFLDNAGSGLHIHADAVAEDCWWGDATGPSGLGQGAGDEVTSEWGVADFEPWAQDAALPACAGQVSGPPSVTAMFPEPIVNGGVRRVSVLGDNLAAGMTARLACTDCAEAGLPEIPVVVVGTAGSVALVEMDLRGSAIVGGYDLVLRNPDGGEVAHPVGIQPYLSLPWIAPTGVQRIPVLPAPLFRTSCLNVFNFSNSPEVGFFTIELTPPAPGVVRLAIRSGNEVVWDSEEAEDPTRVRLIVPVEGSKEVCLTLMMAVDPSKVIFPEALAAAYGLPLGGEEQFVIFGEGQQLTWKGVGSATKDAVKGMIVDTLISLACGGLGDLLVGDENLTNVKKAVADVVDGLPGGVAKTPEYVMKEVAKKLAEKIPGVGIVTKVAGCLNQILGAFFNAFEAASKGAADRLRAKHTGSVEDAQMDAIDQAMAKGGHTLYAALAAQKVVEKLAEPPCNPAPSHYDTSQYPVSASWDPNDKRTGGAYPCEPAGEGAEQACGRHFVPLAQATEPIDYVILFENKAAATEPAEDVTITDLLDADLDPQTLQVLGSSHPAALQPPAVDGQEVVFRFEDVALPPNVAKPQGEGFVAFRVRPRAGLAAGAEIRNKASIVFDFNPAIETPEVVHVLGLADLDVAPASHDFGEVAIASPSGPVGFTLKNLGGQPLALASIVLEGAGAGAFHLSDGGCAGRTLALGETCNATVRFVPDAAGERTAALRVRSSDAATPTLDVPLAGIGLGPEIEVTPGEAALPALASPGDAGVPVLQVRLRAGAAEAVRVESLALRAGGDADDARDVTRVRVVRDDDGDGAADAGEAVLWAGAWPADDGTVVAMLSPALEVPAGASATLLVVYDLAGPAGAAAMPGALLAIVLVLPAVRRRGRRVVPAIVAAVATAAACGGGNGGGGDDVPGPKRHALTVTRSGAGSGTVTGTPAGIACGTACSATYDEGTAVTLTATADVSSVFAGFGGACAGTGACTVTMDGPREVTAAFAAARRHRVSVTGVTAAGAVSGVGAEATGLPVTGSDLVVPR